MPTGMLTHYDAERGFGFLGRRPHARFVHVSEFEKVGLQPTIGQAYLYNNGTGRDGRERAVDIALDDGFIEV